MRFSLIALSLSLSQSLSFSLFVWLPRISLSYVLPYPLSSINRASLSDCVVLYLRHLLGQFNPSAETQSIYSTASANWAASDKSHKYVPIYIYMCVYMCSCRQTRIMIIWYLYINIYEKKGRRTKDIYLMLLMIYLFYRVSQNRCKPINMIMICFGDKSNGVIWNTSYKKCILWAKDIKLMDFLNWYYISIQVMQSFFEFLVSVINHYHINGLNFFWDSFEWFLSANK